MTLRTKIEPINRDIELMLSETLSPKAQSAALAEFAGVQIEDAKETDRRILGRIPRYTVSVDGRQGASLGSVKPGGVIIAEFELIGDVLKWIADRLTQNSPVGSGRDRHPGFYRQSHTLFADGVETDVGALIPNATEYAFVSEVPYSRKIERGSSSQAPDGVYQAVAASARRRFGNIAKIDFTYRAILEGEQINQALAPSFEGNFFGKFHEGRAASGLRESRLAKKFGKTAHNKSHVRFPSIVVNVRG